MGRALIAVAGVLLAFLAGLVALVLLLVLAAMREPPAMSLQLVDLAAWTGLAVLRDAGAGLWRGALIVCLVPVAVVAVVGEAARIRSGLWYAGGTGALTTAVPVFMNAVAGGASEGASPFGARLALLLFLTGVAAGGVFWIVAGRSAATP